MSQTVTLSACKTSFTVEHGETILAAAKRQNLNLPHSCQSGSCGQCKAGLLSGEIELGQYSDEALNAEERAAGKILMCCSTAQSDVVLDVPGYSADMPAVKTLPARVKSVEYLHDVAVIRLALPKAPPFAFLAGQYLSILMKDNHTRNYSIASSPDTPDQLELHVRKRQGGLFSGLLFGDRPAVKEGAIIRIQAPLGTFFIKKNSCAPLLLLATGTGFAPIKSILHYLTGHDPKRSVHLYWGARHEADLYQAGVAAEMIAALPNARFTQVLSRPQEGWQGAKGYIHQKVMEDYTDLSGYEVYACGSPAMIADAQKLLETNCKLPACSFFSDAFSPSTPA